MTKIYQAIARKVEAMRNCNESGNGEWFMRHWGAIDEIITEKFPNGSGFDAGTKFDVCDNVDHGKNKLVFNVSFHHMNGVGMYSGWTEHSVIVTPSLAHGFNMKITGRDKNDIKEYIADTFSRILNEEI